MANMGKRMVKEPLIAQIGQTGPEYTAGTGIDITEDVISVDNTVAMKDDIETYTAGTGIAIDSTTDTIAFDKSNYTLIPKFEFTETIDSVLTELQADNPEATMQDAAIEWCKRMPILIGRSADAETALTTAGYKNIQSFQMGDEFYFKGYIGIVSEDAVSPFGFTGHVYICSTSNANSNIDTYVPGDYKHFLKDASQQYSVFESRYGRHSNKHITSLVDPFNDPIYVNMLQGTVHTKTILETSSMNAGVGYSELSISLKNPSTNNHGNQMIVPTADGTYTLKVTVSSGEPTFSWVLDQA